MREAQATSPASRSGRAVLSRRSRAPRGPTTTASAGGTPFGFSFGLRNELFVSEAAGSASSYELDPRGNVTLVSGAVPTHQGAPCWAVVTNDARIGFTGNGAGSVSAFA